MPAQAAASSLLRNPPLASLPLRSRSGNVLELLEDIQELRPTIFSSVPRLWNRIYDKVMAQIQAANPVSRSLFNTAYRYKQAALAAGDLSGGRLGPFWDRLVFSKIKARVGGEAGVGGSAQGVRWRAIMRSYLHLLPGAHEIGGPACG
jgi:long-subunit acyl-CoA synthetase (AMP-forming)